MVKLINEDYYIEMANVLGRKVKVPHKLPFSFYFSVRKNNEHNIRVKPVFNSNELNPNDVGTLKLCDDWEFIPGNNEKHLSKAEINEMKSFFKEYIVLFCLVWEYKLREDVVQDYFRGLIDFQELIEEITFYTADMDNLSNISELEDYCRKYNLVNFYGN